MLRRIIFAPLVMSLASCNGFVGEAKLVKRIPAEAAPQDAREVASGTYVKIVQVKNLGAKIDELAVFGYSETTNPQSPRESVTSLEEGHPESIPPGLRPVFAGARVGETRRVWNCPSSSRTRCRVSEYTFYRQPE